MDQRGQDDGENAPPFGSEDDQPMRRRGTVQPQAGQQAWSQPDNPGAGQVGYGAPMVYPPAPPPKKKTSKLGLGCLGIVVLVIAISIATVASGKKSPTAASSPPAAAPAAVPVATGTGAAVVVPVATTPAAPPPAQTVTYSCTGHAADGVNITYGAEGSDASASQLPFSVTVPLAANAQYFNVTAQLQGDGSVSCGTVVDWTDDSGDAQSATQSGTASGGYNIASAEVCGDFDGGWDAC